jgi:hypothetical protein
VTLLPEIENVLLDAIRRDHARGSVDRAPGGARRGWLRRGRPLALIAVLVLAGTSAALAAAGVFQLGSPVGANAPQNPYALDGVVEHGSARVLPLSVPDPQGGPAWGLRIARTTRGLICVQYGRRDYQTIGILGIDHAFRDDHRFHPISPKSDQDSGQGCATIDGHGHGFVSVTVQAIAASGLQSCYSYAPSLFAGVPRPDVLRRLHGSPGTTCPPADLRDLYYGMLGPDATSITYPGPNGKQVTEKTAGADGAYLALGPPSDVKCQPGGGCGNGDSYGPGLSPGFITSVTYNNGTVCHIAAIGEQEERAAARSRAQLLARFPALAPLFHGAPAYHVTARQKAILASTEFRNYTRSHPQVPPHQTCPLLGYAAPPVHHVSASEVAAPITVHIGKPVKPRCHRAGRQSSCGSTEINASISFTARVAVTNIASHYETNAKFTATGPCRQGAAAGSGAPTFTDIHAGQRVTQRLYLSACPGVIHGEVLYIQNNGASTNQTVPALPGQGQGVIVGTFSFRLP